MKYIIIEHKVTGERFPVLFSEKLIHRDIAWGYASAAQKDTYKVRSAGFVYGLKSGAIRIDSKGSESLRLNCNAEDLDVIRAYFAPTIARREDG